MAHRHEKIESTLQRVISEVLQRRISDPRLEGFISITRVQLSPDMREAFVYVSVLPAHKQRRVLGGLQHASSHIRTLVGRAMVIKTLPRLEFRLDETLKTEAGVYDAIRRGLDRTGLPREDEDAWPPSSSEEEDDVPPEPTDSTR